MGLPNSTNFGEESAGQINSLSGFYLRKKVEAAHCVGLSSLPNTQRERR